MEPNATPNRREMPVSAAKTDPRTPRILARTLFRDMTQQGLTNDQILSIASELIGMVTDQLRDTQKEPKGNA